MPASLVKYAFFCQFDIFCFFIKDQVFEDVWIDIWVFYLVPLVLLSVLMTVGAYRTNAGWNQESRWRVFRLNEFTEHEFELEQLPYCSAGASFYTMAPKEEGAA